MCKVKALWICVIVIALLLSTTACDKGSPAETTQSSTTQTTLPLSSATDTTVPEAEEHFEFVFNPYVLTWEYEELYGSEFVRIYKAFADAALNFEPSFSCPDEDTFAALYRLQRTDMPWFDAVAYLTFDSYDSETGTVTINYKQQTAAEHSLAMASFVDKVTSILENCLREGDNELVRCLALYQEVSSVIMFDSDLPYEQDSPYLAIMKNRGSAESISGAYVYLLLQADIKANVCGGLTYDRTAAHEWCIVSIDGKYYYADPTFENGETGGLGLSYFGMNTQKRADTGGFDPAIMRIGLTGMLWGKDIEVESDRFSVFEGCDYFELDREQNRIIFRIDGKSDVYFAY